MKDSPSKVDHIGVKVRTANDAVQSIKQLRKEIVEIMSQLLCLAKSKNPKGMLSLCNDMVNKTRALLNIWEPSLVEEAFAFIENHRIIEEPDNTALPLSPFRKITQQLGALDLKSPDLEDFATPMDAPPDLWPQIKSATISKTISANRKICESPSATDIKVIASVQNSVKNFHRTKSVASSFGDGYASNDATVHSLPPSSSLNVKNGNDDGGLRFSETHFDVNGDVSSSSEQSKVATTTKMSLNGHSRYTEDRDLAMKRQLRESKKEILLNSNDFDDDDYGGPNSSIVFGHNGAFLDTKAMSSSPSANYYRPTEEPEPLDLTQLNIEASVMCLVSKVKFLCGRCGSPAVRLRQPKPAMRRGFSNLSESVMTSQPTVIAPCHELDEVAVSEKDTPMASITTGHAQSNSSVENAKTGSLNSKDLNLALTQAIGDVTRKVKMGNKFTDGLDLSMTTDWASELRPSMRKLRQAMDGLLKTARLMHSVQRLQQDMKKTSSNLAIMFRRDVCFSQAVSVRLNADPSVIK